MKSSLTRISYYLRKSVLKSAFILSAILVAGGGIFLYGYFHSKSASAAWFDEGWAYRKAVTVTVTSSSSDITNLETLITADTSASGRFQSSCQDLRFTNTNGKLLPYYIDSGCTTSSTKIWIMLDLVPKNTTTYTLYMYYGNPTASAASDSTKFRLFNGLKGYWKMNDNVSGDAKTLTDASVNANSGTTYYGANTTGMDCTITAKYDKGCTLDGTDDYVSLGNPAALQISTDITINIWVKPTSGSYIISRRGWNILLGQPPAFETRNAGDTGWDTNATATSTLPTDSWSMVTAVYSTTDQKKYIYINGVQEGSAAKTDGSMGDTTARNIYLGQYIVGSQWYNGSEDELRIYNRALSQSEITQLYQNPGNIATYVDGISKPTTSFATEEQGPGPIGYWKFDDGQGSTAQDSTSSNYDGTITGATWQTEDKCISSKCLYLTSATDRVTAGSSNNLNITSGDATYQTWVRLTAATFLDGSTNWTLFNNESYQASGMTIRIDGGTGKLMYRSSQAAASTTFTTTSAPIASNNTWYHITAVKSGTTISFYVNGRLIQSGTITNPVTTANAFTIGSAVGGSQSVRGFMDDAKVYNFARTPAQILQDYASGLANAGTKQGSSAVLGASTEKWLSDGLVGYWKMDESSGNAADSSGNATTLTNNNITTFAAGKFGNGSSYNGTSQYFSTASTISGVQSIAFWVYPTSTTDNYINLNGSTYITSSSGTVSGTGITSPSIYVNGTLNGTITASAWNHVVITTATSVSASVFEIGRANSSYLSNTSKMDEIRVYNRALSSAEISSLYNWAPGPSGYWNFEERTGTSTYDTSGGGNTGTITNSTWNTGKFGAGLSFDGNGDFVNIPQTTTLDTPTGTISMWANFNDLTDNGYLWSQNVDEWNIYNNGTQLKTYYDSTLVHSYTPTFTNNQWVHLSFTFTKGGTCYFYVNGVQVASNTCSSTAPTLSNIHIGAMSSNNTYSFNGKLDDVKVYNYQRTQKQVVQDMNAGHPAVGSPVGSPIGHWKFDEGADNTCSGGTNDTCNSSSQGSTLDGASSGATWSQSGKFGRALSFDGTDDVVTITNSNPIDMDTSLANFTYSAWINATGAGENNVGQILQKGASTYLRVDNPSGSNLDVEANLDLATTDANVNVSAPITTNTWHQIIETWDGTTLTVYIDGVNKGTGTGSGAISSDANNLLIGGTTTANFAGTIDEFKVYNYALTADEVKTEYNRSSSVVLGSLSDNSSYQTQAANQEYCVPGDTTSCAAPVGRWDFEEGGYNGTSGEVKDRSGNGYNGTYNGTLTNLSAPGKAGKAGNFNGSNNYVLASDNDTLSFTDKKMTVSAWIKGSAFGDNNGIVVKRASSNFEYGFYVSASKLSFNIWTSAGASVCSTAGSATLSTNTWYFVTAVADGTNCLLYLNGARDGNAGTVSGTVTNGTAGVYIGYDNSGVSRYFNGQIDQVSIYNYARTAAQVAWDYNRGKPVGHWKFDECQGTTAYDSSPSAGSGQAGNNGTITIGASGEDTVGTCTTSSTAWGSGVTGKRNYSLSLDGTDDKVTIGTAINGVQSITFWVKPSTNTDSFIDLDGGTHYITSSSGTVSATGFSSPTIYVNGISGGTITGAAWNHIVVTTGTSFNTTSSMTFGYKSAATADYLNGQIDDVRVYNYALTLTQIKEIMNDGAIRFGPATGAP